MTRLYVAEIRQTPDSPWETWAFWHGGHVRDAIEVYNQDGQDYRIRRVKTPEEAIALSRTSKNAILLKRTEEYIWVTI